MKKLILLCLLAVVGASYSQNDLDVMRYSRSGIGGSARFTGMGGAFGAVGADMSVANYNPAGLAVYRKSDISFGFKFRNTANSTLLNKKSTYASDGGMAFDNFGMVFSFSASDPESRHSIAFTNVQSQNFSNSIRMSNSTNSKSIVVDMLNMAKGLPLNALSNSYEGLAYDTYLLDYDSVSAGYFSFLDTKRTVNQVRKLDYTGRVNDLNFSWAYTEKDKWYFGASLGLPQVNFSSTTTHIESDDNDSMRVTMTSATTFTSTYLSDLPFVYPTRLGFRSLTYEEYFKTKGSGVNLKLGFIYRLSDNFRLGGYYHTSTAYRLTDEYSTSLTVQFDKIGSEAESLSVPENGGTFTYKIRTPSRAALNLAYLFGKLGVIAVDYEVVNYQNGVLSASDFDFVSTNNFIGKNYEMGQNLRVGGELNLNQFKFRGGYAMSGSPFGGLFTGPLVRNTFSLGMGYKSKGSFYLDLAYLVTFTDQNYYLYSSLDTKAEISTTATAFSSTIGFKF